MDIKQIRKDFDNGVLLSRATWAELLQFAEQADAVIAGRQVAIGALELKLADADSTLTMLGRAVVDNAVAERKAPNATIDSDEFRQLLLACQRIETSSEQFRQDRAALIAHIDVCLASAQGDGRDADQIGPREIVERRKTCNGCPALKTEHWVDYLENDETDSGTSARCAKADKGITAYWSARTPPPDWCPAAIAAATQDQKGG